MSDENLIGKVTSQQRNAQLQPPHDDTTELAYDTTWGTIRIYNLTAREDDATHLVDFKAFVKSFRDTFSPGWTESHYPNQSVPIAHQARPRRIIQLSFSVPASSADEAIRNMQKVSFLAQTMFPTIEFDGSSDAYRVKSNFVAIKFANLVQNQRDGGPLPGWISGFNFIPNLEEGSFVLNGKETGKKSVAKEAFKQTDQSYIIPKLIDIDIMIVIKNIRINPKGLRSSSLNNHS